MRGHRILQEMIKLEQQMFILVDAKNTTIGVVTIEDVIETMLCEEIEDGFKIYSKHREKGKNREKT